MPKKTLLPVTLHRDCKSSDLHQWPGDPLVVRCLRSGERWPASMGCRCPLFRKREVPAPIPIQHRHNDGYDWSIHPSTP